LGERDENDPVLFLNPSPREERGENNPALFLNLSPTGGEG